MTVIIIWHIILCARGCVCVCVCVYGRVYSLTSTSVWFQTFPPFPVRVCVRWDLRLRVWVSFRTQTVPVLSHYRDRWAAVTERAGCVHVMDRCSRAEEMQISTVTFLLLGERFFFSSAELEVRSCSDASQLKHPEPISFSSIFLLEFFFSFLFLKTIFGCLFF